MQPPLTPFILLAQVLVKALWRGADFTGGDKKQENDDNWKRGQKVEVPCEVKIKALKFLAEAYDRKHEYEDVDFDDEMYRE